MTASRFRRTNYVLWTLIAALLVFILIAQVVPAHWALGGVVAVLFLTRSRKDDPTEPRAHSSDDTDVVPSTARFADDIPTVVVHCLWCGDPLGEELSDFCNDECRESWYTAQASGTDR